MRDLLIDTDNALGSKRGDIDDAYAIAALLMSTVKVSAISCVGGNTTAERSYENTSKLAKYCEFSGPVLRGSNPKCQSPSETSRYLCEAGSDWCVLALGPLTNIAQAIRDGAKIGELLLIGGNLKSRGRWPPFWPYEFNLTKDRIATYDVLSSVPKITVIPLDIAYKLKISWHEVQDLQGQLGEYLTSQSRRWFLRNLFFKFSRYVPIWDLVGAMYLVKPKLFSSEKRKIGSHLSGWIDFHTGSNCVTVVTGFSSAVVWDEFKRLIKKPSLHS